MATCAGSQCHKLEDDAVATGLPAEASAARTDTPSLKSGKIVAAPSRRNRLAMVPGAMPTKGSPNERAVRTS